MAQSNFLTIRDNGNDGITVTGLSLVKPNGAEDLLSLLKYGNSNRTQHPTDHNAESSRSHAVFQVNIIFHVLPLRVIKLVTLGMDQTK